MVESINRTEKRGRGRPRVDPTSIHVTLPPAELAVLDRHIAEQPEPRPSRPEAIRRVLSERFASDAAPKPVTGIPAAKDTHARQHATMATEKALSEVDAPAAEKVRRRKVLTEKPAMIAKARGKRKPVEPGDD